MKKLNKIISGALAALMIFTSVPVYAVNDISTERNTEISTETEENTSENISDGTEETSSSPETEETEIQNIEDRPTVFLDEDLAETDGWELSVVFYDSTVDNGTTPLTSIDWDASDGGYGEGTPRVITVQINYNNTNTVTTYQPGDLEISIPNLGYGLDATTYGKTDTMLYCEITVGANDNTHSGYDWNFSTGSYPTVNQKNLKFSNAKKIEEKSNFEGSIQIQYSLTPKQCIKEYVDSNLLTYSIDLAASMNDIISNKISFSYQREYIHVWKKAEYPLKKEALKVNSIDGLNIDIDKYYLVKYLFTTDLSPNGNLLIPAENIRIKDFIPNDCIVKNKSGTDLTPDENGYYIINDFEKESYDIYTTSIIVAYPKDTYEGTIVTNTAQLYGVYKTETEESLLATADCKINPNDFEFTYNGSLYSINKYRYEGTDEARNPFSYQFIQRGEAYVEWDNRITAVYTGKKMTLKIGDDLLYATDSTGNYVKLTDDEYYFSNITIPVFKDYYSNVISGKEIEVYVRYSGQNEYTKYGQTIISSNKVNTINFSKSDGVVGFYILIHDLDTSIYPYGEIKRSKNLGCTTYFTKKDIPESGNIYNFSYLQVYTENENGELILQNTPTLDSYNNFITKKEIADYDMTTYGLYMQRSYSSANWFYINIPKNYYGSVLDKSFDSIIQNEEKELFEGKFTITFGAKMSNGYDESVYLKLFDQFDETQFIPDIVAYDLLPEGMELESTEEEIFNSICIGYDDNSPYAHIYNKNKEQVFKTENEFLNFLKDNTTIEITKNWNNTNRTRIKIHISLKEHELFYINNSVNRKISGAGGSNAYPFGIKLTINFSINYDSYLDFGSVWKNFGYSELLDYENPIRNASSSEGFSYNDSMDLNENGLTTDMLNGNSDSITIPYIVSTYQDVQAQTASSLSNYSTGTVPAEYGKDYSYKLRVRTGQNDVTNLIIYDNLEKWTKDKDGNFIESYGNKKYWQGEFLGVDTSYAGSKGYTVKVWYSENEKAGTLAEDPSWQEYSDSIDKTKVKSLAFQYFDAEGNPAVLPANSLTYVVVNMKAPADESITTLAYNGCWTQWNAIDEFGQPVDFITGINSNIVKVALPNSVIENEIPSIQLNIEKEIQGTQEAFENMQLDPNGEYQFMISLVKQEANEDDSHDIINGVISNKKGLVIKDLSCGTWLIQESDDTYFDLVEIISLDDPEIMTPGVTFEKTDAGYMLTINEDIDSATEYSLKVINEIEPERFYEDKDSEVNLFNGTPLVEEQSLLDKLINFFE